MLLGGVVVDERPDHPRHRAGHGHLAGAQQRDTVHPQPPGRDGRELGVEVVGEREDAADHRVGHERVALHQLANQPVGGVENRAGIVALDAIGASEREQPHGRRFCQRRREGPGCPASHTRWRSRSGALDTVSDASDRVRFAVVWQSASTNRAPVRRTNPGRLGGMSRQTGDWAVRVQRATSWLGPQAVADQRAPAGLGRDDGPEIAAA